MTTFQLLDKLDAATEVALRESIRRWGVIVPVVEDQHGRTIDGHQRKRIAKRLGVDVPTRKVRVLDDDDARELAVSLNVDRRMTNVAARKRIVQGLRASGHSQRAIAGAVGVSKTQVHRDLSGGPPGPPATNGRDGKQYPANRKAPTTPRRRPFNDDTETTCPSCGGTGRVRIGDTQ